MRRAGVSDGRPVVVYDEADATVAARAWWLLRYFGHGACRVLDGGFRAWQAAGGQVATGDGAVPAPGDFTARPGHMPVLDADGAASLARRGVLLDARARERYRGETEPIDPVAGHIPGAISAPTTGNVGPGRPLPARRRAAGPVRGARRRRGRAAPPGRRLLRFRGDRRARGARAGDRRYPRRRCTPGPGRTGSRTPRARSPPARSRVRCPQAARWPHMASVRCVRARGGAPPRRTGRSGVHGIGPVAVARARTRRPGALAGTGSRHGPSKTVRAGLGSQASPTTSGPGGPGRESTVVRTDGAAKGRSAAGPPAGGGRRPGAGAKRGGGESTARGREKYSAAEGAGNGEAGREARGRDKHGVWRDRRRPRDRARRLRERRGRGPAPRSRRRRRVSRPRRPSARSTPAGR